MPKNVLIVESPAKAKTIEKFLGKDFKVVSSFGHIRDLPKGKMAIDVEKDFEPQYVIPDDKKEIVKQLKKIAKEAEQVWLATDEDREGEAISWHLCEILGLDPEDTKRIVFHEITKPAIQKAIESPRTINQNVVNAQQARRVLDRLVGFELSPILWKKVSSKSALSAGRVQSVAVRLIVEREREIENFAISSNFKINAYFLITDDSGKQYELKAELPESIKSKEEAESYLKSCLNATFSIRDIEVKPAKKSPSAPFTTSTLQQEASRKLGFSVAKTMLIAQKLYESGRITYMRTDSVNLSDQALAATAQTIENNFGQEYVKVRKYKTKSSGAQEAHEAIRPTNPSNRDIEGNRDESRLYDLIWKRTIASQMSDAKLEKTLVYINNSNNKSELIARGEVILFDGFLKVYFESTDDEHEEDTAGLLPPINVGQSLDLNKMIAFEKFTRPAARFTEASLVKKLEELGIGRPSTYAPTISTIQKREYVEKTDKSGKSRKVRRIILESGEISKMEETENYGAEKAKLFPTDVGIIVTDFLNDNFPNIMDYHFTANIEKDFDHIADGKETWNKVIGQFYKPFHGNVTHTLENAKRVTGEKELGIDPKTGKKVFAKMGKFGPMIQIGTTEDEDRSFASMQANQQIGSITLEEALELFKLPRVIGIHEDEEVLAGSGRYGPFVKFKNKYYSIKGKDPLSITLDEAKELFNLPRTLGNHEDEEIIADEGRFGPYVKYKGKFYNIKGKDPITITLQEAIDIINAKNNGNGKKAIKSFEKEGIEVLNGFYGPYIKANKRNYKIPKDKVPDELTLEECQDIIENAPPPKKKKRATRKKN
jgi:DNA topoisomerase I